MKIAIASDHAGFSYKEQIKTVLIEQGHELKDFGAHSAEPVDYPDYIRPAAEAVASAECECGIVLGGSGNGEAMVANKVRGIRCAVCWDLRSAKLSREHNNANMFSLGERMLSIHEALEIVDLWLKTPFAGDRHQRRIEKIEKQQG
ncbi:MAG: ribose 5-phosphate isomerase B [Planctomycetota bacterium]|nr:MAG: ribose 5-phosphate isomerase B [Planctomycetota bacterium]